MNCKPGDLAVIVGASREKFVANIGKIVEVLEPASDYFVQLAGGLHCWRVKSRGGPVLTREGMGPFGVARDCDLRPIRSDETEQEAALPRTIAMIRPM